MVGFNMFQPWFHPWFSHGFPWSLIHGLPPGDLEDLSTSASEECPERQKPRWKNGAGLWSEAQRIYRIHILYMFVFIWKYIYICIYVYIYIYVYIFFGGGLGACLNPGSQWVNLRLYSFLWREPVFYLHWLHCFGRAEGMFIPTFIEFFFNGRFKSKYINILYISISKITGALSHQTKMETAGPPEDQRWTGGLKTTFLFIVSGNVFFLDLSRSVFFCAVVAVTGMILTICNSTIT